MPSDDMEHRPERAGSLIEQTFVKLLDGEVPAMVFDNCAAVGDAVERHDNRIRSEEREQAAQLVRKILGPQSELGKLVAAAIRKGEGKASDEIESEDEV